MSQARVEEGVRRLAALGFTELEAAVYTYLVEHAPATAYRVAQGIGKPVANTYKAVASLEQKGAVLVDETGNRTCRAVPPAELLERLAGGFRQRHDAAAAALARLRPAEAGEGIYALRTPAQVRERCVRLLEEATDVVLLDAFPGVLDTLRPELESAASRGVVVVVQGYASTELAGVDVVLHASRGEVVSRWPGQWMCLVVDGSSYVFAYLSADGSVVHQALWSESPFLAWLQHSYLSQSLRLMLVEGLVAQGAGEDELADALRRSSSWLAIDARGYRALRESFGAG